MDEFRLDRRRVLRAGTGLAGIAALVSLSGCNGGSGTGDTDESPDGGTDEDGDESGPAGPIEQVPVGSSLVLHADVGGILDSRDFRDAVNSVLQESDLRLAPSSVAAALDIVQESFGADPRQLTAATLFARREGTGAVDGGAIIESEWTDEEVETLVEREAPHLERRTHQGSTVFVSTEPTDQWLALPGDGAVVIGTKTSVTDVLALRSGGGEALGGRLREAVTGTAPGYVRFATRPTELLPPDELDLRGPAGDIELVHGSVASGEERRLSVTVEVADQEAARTLEGQFEGSRRELRQYADRATDDYPAFGRRATDILGNASVSRDGAAVTLTVPQGLQVAGTGLLAAVASFVLGIGGQTQTAPQVAFAFEYDETAETLTATHEGGDHVRAAALYLRGREVPQSPAGTGPGGSVRWDEAGGSASGRIGDDPAVTAGDTVELESVPPEYEVRVVWESREEAVSATLAADEGPAA